MSDIKSWEMDLGGVLARFGFVFESRLGRERLSLYVRGLLGPAERKNGWHLAEEAGEETPYGMQQFLFRGGWSAYDLS